MRLSKNWLNEWIDLSAKSAEDICAALNEIGLEVDSCERIRVPSKVVVAKVLECREHENSDHLHVCKVDAGEILQIVCGAPNVAEGQMVACARVETAGRAGRVEDIVCGRGVGDIDGADGQGERLLFFFLFLGEAFDDAVDVEGRRGVLAVEAGGEAFDVDIVDDDAAGAQEVHELEARRDMMDGGSFHAIIVFG